MKVEVSNGELLDKLSILELKLKNIKDDKKYLLRQLTDKLSNVCDNQLCWIRQSFVKKLQDQDILENTFALATDFFFKIGRSKYLQNRVLTAEQSFPFIELQSVQQR